MRQLEMPQDVEDGFGARQGFLCCDNMNENVALLNSNSACNNSTSNKMVGNVWSSEQRCQVTGRHTMQGFCAAVTIIGIYVTHCCLRQVEGEDGEVPKFKQDRFWPHHVGLEHGDDHGALWPTPLLLAYSSCCLRP